MKDYLRLFRVLNLMFIVMIMSFLHWFILEPADRSILSTFEFSLLVFSTVLVAAAGYVINDYFDIRIDVINRPGMVIVDRSISRRQAMLMHQVMNACAVIIGIFVAVRSERVPLALIQPVCITLLWFYSTSFKKMFLVGNVVVAFLTALVIATVFLYDAKDPVDMSAERKLAAAFMYFAFLSSLLRELVKDMEDLDGDRTENCRTAPTVLGIPTTRKISILIAIIFIGSVSIVQILSDFGLAVHLYIFFCIHLPLVIIIRYLTTAQSPAQFRLISHLIKLLMLAGILYIPFSYQFAS